MFAIYNFFHFEIFFEERKTERLTRYIKNKNGNNKFPNSVNYGLCK